MWQLFVQNTVKTMQQIKEKRQAGANIIYHTHFPGIGWFFKLISQNENVCLYEASLVRGLPDPNSSNVDIWNWSLALVWFLSMFQFLKIPFSNSEYVGTESQLNKRIMSWRYPGQISITSNNSVNTIMVLLVTLHYRLKDINYLFLNWYITCLTMTALIR